MCFSYFYPGHLHRTRAIPEAGEEKIKERKVTVPKVGVGTLNLERAEARLEAHRTEQNIKAPVRETDLKVTFPPPRTTINVPNRAISIVLNVPDRDLILGSTSESRRRREVVARPPVRHRARLVMLNANSRIKVMGTPSARRSPPIGSTIPQR